jgi:hypothetical protein
METLMISALLLAIAGLSTPAAPQTAAYGSDTIAHLKGHPSVPAREDSPKQASVPAACHPDNSKGRVCRIANARAEDARRETNALAEAETVNAGEMAR